MSIDLTMNLTPDIAIMVKSVNTVAMAMKLKGRSALRPMTAKTSEITDENYSAPKQNRRQNVTRQ
jgi:hypothetical protein